MSRSPSISQPIPTDKDPPRSPPPTTTSSSQRRPSQTQRQISSSPKDHNRSMPPPPRPSISTRTRSFDPNPHVLNPTSPSPHPDIAVQSASQSLNSASQHPQHPINASAEQESKSRNFTPFFTLVNDIGSEDDASAAGGAGGGTFHPSRVHYIFSDDDASELLTAALLRAEAQNSRVDDRDDGIAETGDSNPDDDSGVYSRGSLDRSLLSDRPLNTGGTNTHTTTTTTSSSSSATFHKDDIRRDSSKKKGGGKSRQKHPIAKEEQVERQERIVIVDVNASLDGVDRITSLSRDWQVLNVRIEHAPSFDARGASSGGAEGEDGGDDEGKGLMLRIEGVGSGKGRDGEGGGGYGGGGGGMMGEEEMQALMERFDKKMAVLRRVVDSGGGGAGGGVVTGEGEVREE